MLFSLVPHVPSLRKLPQKPILEELVALIGNTGNTIHTIGIGTPMIKTFVNLAPQVPPWGEEVAICKDL